MLESDLVESLKAEKRLRGLARCRGGREREKRLC